MFYVLSSILMFSPWFLGSNRFWAYYPIALILIISYIKFPSRENNQRHLPKTIKYPANIIIILTVISVLFSVNIYSSINFLFILSAAFLAFSLSDHLTEKEKILTGFIMIFQGILQSLTAFLQLSGYISHSWWDPPQYMAGTFVNHNHLAGLLEITIPLTIAYFLFYLKSAKLYFKIFLIISFLLQMAAILFSCSRGAWIGILCGLFFFCLYIFNKNNIKYSVSLFLVTLFFTFFLFSDISSGPVIARLKSFLYLPEDCSFSIRIQLLGSCCEIIKNNFLFGTGIGTFSDIINVYRPISVDGLINHAHNEYLELLCETGIFTLPPLLFLISSMLFHCYKTGVNGSPFPAAFAASLISLSVHGLSDFNMRIPSNLLYMAILAGIALKSNGLKKE